MSVYHSDAEERGEGPALDLGEHLDLALRGRLPCVVCGYDLKGISIRSVCPECGIAVRATILYTVDPKADEFQPIRFPRVTSLALILWAAGAAVATLASWWPRLADVIARTDLAKPPSAWADWLTLGAAVVSGIAIVGFIRPLPTTPISKSLGAALAVLAYIPLVLGTWWTRFGIDPSSPNPYLEEIASSQRLVAALVVQACIVIIILSVRPNARDFVRRSMAMRTGSVDRQTLISLVVVVLVAMIATLARLAAGRLLPSASDLAHTIDLFAQILTALAWGLFTIGTLSVLRDTIRLRGVILITPPSLREVIHGPDEDEQR